MILVRAPSAGNRWFTARSGFSGIRRRVKRGEPILPDTSGEATRFATRTLNPVRERSSAATYRGRCLSKFASNSGASVSSPSSWIAFSYVERASSHSPMASQALPSQHHAHPSAGTSSV